MINYLNVQNIMTQYTDLFADELGHAKNVKAHVELQSGATLKFCKSRPVPVALKPKIEED